MISSNNFRSWFFWGITLINALECLGGGYPLDKGEMFFQSTLKYVYAENYYSFNGTKVPLAATTEVSNTTFSEVGLHPRISLVFNMQLYKYFITEGPSAKSPYDIIYSGTSDSQIGLKWGIYRDKWFEISSWAKLGLATSELFNGYSQTKPVIPLNHSDFPIYLGADLETHTFKFPLTTGATLGFKARNFGQGRKNYSDEIIFGLKASYPINRVFIILSGNGEISLWNGDYERDVSYFAIGPQIYTKLEKNLGLVFGFESSAFNENTLSGIAYKFGIYMTK